VPDEVVRRAEQLELVDLTPEALRRRLAHGNVYPAERIDAALGNYFRPGNLTALRELALLWVADQVDVALQRYRAEQRITDTSEAGGRLRARLGASPLGFSRLVAGWVLGFALPVLVTVVGVFVPSRLDFATDVISYVLATVVVALVGGLGPALVAAVLGAGLLN